MHYVDVSNISDDNHGGDGDAILKDKSPKKLFGRFLVEICASISINEVFSGQNLRLFLPPLILAVRGRDGHHHGHPHEQVPPHAVCANYLAYKIPNLLFSKPAKVLLLQAIVYGAIRLVNLRKLTFIQ